MGNGIVLSEKYGVNPSVIKCFYCGEDSGVALFGTGFKKKVMHGDGREYLETVEAPHCVGVIDMAPCSKCEEYMKMGIIVISIRDGEGKKIEEQQLDWRARRDAIPEVLRGKYLRPFMPDVYRTGLWTVVKATAPMFRKGFIKPEALRQSIRDLRRVFLENATITQLGLGAAAGMELDAEGHWKSANKENTNEKK